MNKIFIEDRQIKNMEIGESGFAVPWAMWVDMEGSAYLNGEYTVCEDKGGTGQMLVRRKADGWHVFLPAGEKWKRVEQPSYMGAKDSDFISVMELHH